MSILYNFLKVLSVMITSMAMLFFYPNTADTHDVKDPENVKLNFTVLSDSHIEGNNPDTYDVFTKILYDVKNTATENDALVMLGDNTMNGQHIESIFLYGLEKVIDPAEEIINVMGNHDSGNGTGVYDQCLAKFIGYNNAFFGHNISKPYYTKIINGYYIIVLGSEEDGVDYCHMSDEQYFWLKDQLSIASSEGNPVFVVNHHPYFLIDCNYSVEELLNSYQNVFYFFGHTHWALNNFETFTDHGNYISVNLPKCTEIIAEDGGEIDDFSGIGMQVEVYEDEVVLRMRNYYEGGWIEDYERTVEIIKS